MKKCHIIVLSVLLFASGALVAQEQEGAAEVNSCVSCHLEMGDDLAVPVEGMKADVHAQQGLSCADCHGGDPKAGLDGDLEASMDPAKGYIGAPDRKDIPGFCARCHSDPNYMRRFNPRVATDQLSSYRTSVHGRLLAQGDTKVATCIDCHGVHGIHSATDARSSVYARNVPATCAHCHADAEYMSGYDIGSDQMREYSKSVHGVALLEKGDLAAPACNDCHGNHGASPPGAPSIAYICGQCHLNNSELFFKSPHMAAFEELDLPECEACHGNHAVEHPSDELIGAGEQSICLDCHEEDSKGLKTAIAIREQIDSLKSEIGVADSLLAKAERAGMEVSEPLFDLKEANDALVKSRTEIHGFSLERVKKATRPGVELAAQARASGLEALKELSYRHRGLGFSLIFILMLAAGLYLRIKEVDKEHPFRKRD